jgi:GH43 family beta-xylosidase
MADYTFFTDKRPSLVPDLRASVSELNQPNSIGSARRLASGLLLASLAVRAAPAAEALTSTESPHLLAPETSEQDTFSNPIARGADPWVVYHAGYYYFCEPVTDNSIAIWKSDSLTRRGDRRVVWKAPQEGWNSALIWAPELHRLDGRWYIYYAASAAPRDNTSHRVGVLESLTDDPLGPYFDRGMVYTGDDRYGRAANHWAIDATPLELHGRLYLLWSGWPDGEDLQYLYIAQLENPWTTAGPRVRLCDNATYDWERVNNDPRQRGLHEAPQVLKHNGRVFVVYSCSASWQQTYKLGLLELTGDDPLNPADWRKYPQPVFQSSDEVFGVGHASFVKSPDGLEDWIVYHAKISRTPGWRRVICTQRFGWRPDGSPDFGRPVPWQVRQKQPSGSRGVGFLLNGSETRIRPQGRSTRCPRFEPTGSLRPDLAGARYAWRFGHCPCEALVSLPGQTNFRDCRLCRANSTSS